MSNPGDFVIKNGVLKKYKGPGGDVVAPDGVTRIDNFVFQYQNNVKSVSVPEGVTSIGRCAFQDCSALTAVSLPASLKTIEGFAFSGCESLREMKIPENVESLGPYAFSGCAALCGTVVLRSVSEIGDGVFSGCSALSGIELPADLTEIGNNAFLGCASVRSLEIPENVAEIGDRAFAGCAALTEEAFTVIRGVLSGYKGEGGIVQIPSDVVSIGDLAFCGNETLTEVIIPEGVTRIGKEVFFGCSNLRSVTLPSTLTEIGSSAFCNCSSLTEITLPEKLTSIGGWAFSGCSKLEEFTIPQGVARLEERCFRGCVSLTNVEIPSSVTSIGDYCFHDCDSLVRLSLPASVKEISDKFADEKVLIRYPDLSGLPARYWLQAVLCYAEDGGSAEDKRSVNHRKYIKDRVSKLTDTAVAHPALLRLMCREKLIPAKDVELYLAAVQNAGDAELIAIVMDYWNNKISQKEKERLIRQKEQEQEAITARMIARVGKKGIEGLVFAVTGDLETFAKRDELKAVIEQKGGRLASGLSAKVDYLIMNDADSQSAKSVKAQELGIEIITERQFNEKIDRRFLIEGQRLIKYLGAGGEIRIPQDVNCIGRGAFFGVAAVMEVYIPAGVTSIQAYAFDECPNLTIHAPKNSYAEKFAKRKIIPCVVE